MTAEPPPVHIDGWGAILPDGTHVPQEAIDAAVTIIAECCRLIEALPPEQRAALEAEARGRVSEP